MSISINRDLSSQLNDIPNQINAAVIPKANQSDLLTQQGRIDNIVSSASNYYNKCLSTDTGALQVVLSGATTGQINLASVTPKLDTYTPVVGDYVRLVSNGLTAETTDIRVGSDGIAYPNAGSAVRGQVANLLNRIKITSYETDDVKNGISFKRANLFDKTNILVDKSPANLSTSTFNDLIDATNNVTTGQIFKVKYGDVVNTNLQGMVWYLYNEYGVFLERYTGGEKQQTIANTQARFLRFRYGNYADGKISVLVVVIGGTITGSEKYDDVSIETQDLIDLKNDVSMLKNNLTKSYILLNFDDMSEMYNQQLILFKQYGYKFTVCLNSGVQMYADGFYDSSIKARYFDLLDFGCDISMYGWDRLVTSPSNIYTVTVDEWVVLFTPLIEKLNSMGVFPVTYFAPNNTLTANMIEALKKCGFVMGRSGVGNPENTYNYIESFGGERFNTPTVAIHDDTLASVESTIDEAIAGKYSLSIFTHKVVDNNTDSNNCDTTTMTALLNYIKSKVDSGLCEVITYQKYYDIMRGNSIHFERDQKQRAYLQRKIELG